jgi:hypothetical protein
LAASRLETGADLLTVKGKLAHGQFGDWVASECGLSNSTAQNYMKAAAAFGSKNPTVGHLPPTTLYGMA